MNIETYLERIGVPPESITDADFETLERLQRAHIRKVPFENLSVVGDPYGDFEGGDIALDLPALYDKIVRRERGGYCFELNGLFTWLLRELGYDAERVAAAVIGEDGPRPPANHHSVAVELDRRYIVDIGLGVPKPRSPIPIFGESIESGNYEWRIVDSDRPDADFIVQQRRISESEWDSQYQFIDEPRDIDYFRATNDYLQTAPESPFTGSPSVNIATETGYVRCSADSYSVIEPSETTEHELTEGEWHTLLDERFGISMRDQPSMEG